MGSKYSARETFDWGELAGLIIGVAIVVLIERALRVHDWWRRHDHCHGMPKRLT